MDGFMLFVISICVVVLIIATLIYFLSEDTAAHLFGALAMMWAFSLPFTTSDGDIYITELAVGASVYFACGILSFIIHLIRHTKYVNKVIQNDQESNIDYYKYRNGFESFDSVYYRKYNEEVYQKYFKLTGVEIIRCLFYWPILIVSSSVVYMVYLLKKIRFPRINFNIFDIIMRKVYNKWIGR